MGDDLVPEALFLNGKFHFPSVSPFEALAVGGGRVLATGCTRDIEALAKPGMESVDLQGRSATPGLIDSHGHMTSLGRLLTNKIDLSSAKSFEDLLKAVHHRVQKSSPGEWIIGGRWDQVEWGMDSFPSHQKLSTLSPHHPVFLHRVDGHSVLANQKAMELAGIDRNTCAPFGGDIIRDLNGDPTGIFVDNAIALFDSVLPVQREVSGEILAAQEHCLSLGLTGVHDAGIGLEEIAAYEALEEESSLSLRIYGMLFMSPGRESFLRERAPRVGDHFSLRAVKILLDGALGSRGAWLHSDYSDQHGNQGFPLYEMDMLESWARLASEKGWQVCTHAIGDRAVQETLDAYVRAGISKADRPRIEHAQVIGPDDLPRFADQGVIASIQPAHASSDMRWAEDRLGRNRLRGAYAWGSLSRAGVALAGGSDFPVEAPDPWKGVYAAVTRQNLEGEPTGGWMPEERLSREEAFHAFTLGAAYAAFEEGAKGSLSPGTFADFVVWSEDPIHCSSRELLELRALRTVIGGKTVYQRS